MGRKNIKAFSAGYPNESSLLRCTYLEITECPSCHFAIEPKTLCAYYVQPDSPSDGACTLYLLSMCKRCNQVFLSAFQERASRSVSGFADFDSALYSIPYTPNIIKFSDDVRQLSPDFVETYMQAEIAESQRLYRICGVGYRKALEFLVKDYLQHKSPDHADKIPAESLGSFIKRLEDPRIKVLAERSTWIGNDEAHYVRKHDDLDIEDMKRFIKAMLHYIESELAFEEAESIPRG